MDLKQHPDGKGLEFPCSLELMAFGRNREGFADHVVALLLSHGAQRTDAAVSTRVSSAGKYVAVHIPIQVESRQELERLYGVLQADPEIQFRL